MTTPAPEREPEFKPNSRYCYECEETFEGDEDYCENDEGHAVRPEMVTESPVFSADGSDPRDKDYYHHGAQEYRYEEEAFA